MKLSGIDLTFPEFDQKQVLKWTGLNAATLQNWANRGIIQLKPSRPGKRQRRLYSAADIIKLLCIFELSRLGVMPAVASDFADKAVMRRLIDKVEEQREFEKTGEPKIGGATFATFYFDDEEIKYEIWSVSAKSALSRALKKAFEEEPIAKIDFGIDTAIGKVIKAILRDNIEYYQSVIDEQEGKGSA